MNPTKLLIGQILVVFLIVLGGVWAATQWCAAMLGYQPELGAPWFVILDLPIYRPWSIFPWWYHSTPAPRGYCRAYSAAYGGDEPVSQGRAPMDPISIRIWELVRVAGRPGPADCGRGYRSCEGQSSDARLYRKPSQFPGRKPPPSSWRRSQLRTICFTRSDCRQECTAKPFRYELTTHETPFAPAIFECAKREYCRDSSASSPRRKTRTLHRKATIFGADFSSLVSKNRVKSTR